MTIPFGSLVGLMVTGEDVGLTGVISSSDGTTRRVYRRGRLVREENLDGTIRQLAGRELGWTSYGQDVVYASVNDGSSLGGLDVGGERPSWQRWDGADFTRSTGPVTATEFLGRPAWAVELAPPSHKPHPLQLVVDAETGIVLRKANSGFGTWEQWSELEVGVELSDELFEWDGPARDHAEVRAEWLAEHEADLATRRAWLADRGFAPLTLAFEPELRLHEWDDAGAFAASLHLGHGMLLRRPRSELAWDDADRIDYPHTYRWSDARWDWLLAGEVAFDGDRLAAVQARLARTT